MTISAPETFLKGRVSLFCGDCIDVLASMAEGSIDSVVCDPPYHLTSIVKRFGAQNAAPAKTGKTGAYARASRGFMGKQWDGGDIAFRPETWAAVLRVLKPGGHLVAFSGTRTYHRMACAIEDAGFEIRDQIGWAYGSGFPKSHDVSKAIDKRKDWSALPRLQSAVRAARKNRGMSQSEAARAMGLIGPNEDLGGGGFMWFETGLRAPTRDQWPRLKVALRMGDEFDLCFEEAEREITGEVEEWTDRSNYAITSKDGFRRDNPATVAAHQWSGWGTALKPAWEPIVLARKPLTGTVAENVLQHGTGALNLDGCRVGDFVNTTPSGVDRRNAALSDAGYRPGAYQMGETQPNGAMGRWPANIITDGSPEVLGAFPDRDGATSNGKSGVNEIYGGGWGSQPQSPGYADSGSAARFFYTAKADADDRLGSKHPTVKPLDLMQWLVRLVTPPGGMVLDPFAGTGTTAEAAWREGFSATIIEREPEYQNDCRRRMALALSGLDERARAAIKAKNAGRPEDNGPLFQNLDSYDAQADFAGSLEVGYQAIRERVAAGGPGWQQNKDGENV